MVVQGLTAYVLKQLPLLLESRLPPISDIIKEVEVMLTPCVTRAQCPEACIMPLELFMHCGIWLRECKHKVVIILHMVLFS